MSNLMHVDQQRMFPTYHANFKYQTADFCRGPTLLVQSVNKYRRLTGNVIKKLSTACQLNIHKIPGIYHRIDFALQFLCSGRELMTDILIFDQFSISKTHRLEIHELSLCLHSIVPSHEYFWCEFREMLVRTANWFFVNSVSFSSGHFISCERTRPISIASHSICLFNARTYFPAASVFMSQNFWILHGESFLLSFHNVPESIVIQLLTGFSCTKQSCNES